MGIYRAWINQPASLQPFNKYHGSNVIVYSLFVTNDNKKVAKIYFTKGYVVSMNIPQSCLSSGWI